MAKDKSVSWEKTVEWAFVRKYLSNTDFAAPIDGAHEISDAFLAQHGKWYLIEFKHTEADFKAELDKYPYMSRKRACSLLSKNYKTSEAQIKKIEAFEEKPQWVNEVLELEKKLMDLGKAKSENTSLMKKSMNAIASLKDSYGKITMASKGKLEPHFFVYSEDNKFDQLLALPYWSNWNRQKVDKRGWAAFDPDLIAMHGDRFDAFSDYVGMLATARGYNISAMQNEGENDFKAVVLGSIVGFSINRTVAMSLDSFLLIQPELKKAYEASNIAMHETKKSEAKNSLT